MRPDSMLPLLALHLRSGPDLWVIVLVILPLILLFAAMMYRREREAPRGVRRFLTALRTLVILLAFLLAFDPATEVKTARDSRTLVAVLVDDSKSMAEHDPYDTREQDKEAAALRKSLALDPGSSLSSYSRKDLMIRALEQAPSPSSGDKAPSPSSGDKAPPFSSGGKNFIDRLAEKHDVHLFAFGEALEERTPEIPKLDAQGARTALGDAIDLVLRNPNVRGSSHSKIVIFSDGRRTAGQDPLAAAAEAKDQGIPIYTVTVGDPFALRDVSLTSVVADDIVMVDDLMVIEANVLNARFPEQAITIEIVEGGSPVHSESFHLRATDQNQPFRLQYRPSQPGKHDWIVRVRPLPGEKNTANNEQPVTVNVKRERLNVLYVDELPRYEYRRLKNFLIRGQEAFRSQCLLLSAERGFIQESTQDPESPPLTAFPSRREDLDKYHVIILGDVDPEKLVDEDHLVQGTQKSKEATRLLGLIRDFVESGGGLALIAGEHYNPDKYKDTPLEDVLPVVLSGGDEAQPPSKWDVAWKPQLTPLGRVSPLLQLDPDPVENARIWEDPDYGLEPMYKYYPVRRESRAAQVLARHPTDGNHFGKYVIYATQTYGEGSVFFSATDESWAWFKVVGPKWFNQFWGGIVKHLGRGKLYSGSRRYHLTTDKTRYRLFETVKLRARVRDPSYKLSTEEIQRATVVAPVGGGREEPVEMVRTEPGIYEYLFEAKDLGRYEAWIQPDRSTDEKDRVRATPFVVESKDEETAEPAVDEETMRAIAERSGGAAVELDNLSKLADVMDSDTVRQTTHRDSVPLRREPWIPAVFIALLTMEWLVRKRFRML